MKSLFLTVLLSLFFGAFLTAEAQTEQQIKVLVGKQKKASRSKLIVKFESLTEDSRCPVGVNCVWAGNAKIKVTVQQGNDPAETFEMNTNLGAKGANYGSFYINLLSLTPTPAANVRINRNAYAATFSINRLTR